MIDNSILRFVVVGILDLHAFTRPRFPSIATFIARLAITRADADRREWTLGVTRRQSA
jgi:hypothetical protein